MVRSFRTLEDGQRSVAVPVVEGESERPEFCVFLGKCVVRDLPPGLPKGTKVEVAYRYLANGRLAVSAWVPSTGHSAGVEIQRARSLAGTPRAPGRRNCAAAGRRPTARRPRPRPAAVGRPRRLAPAGCGNSILLHERIGRLAARLEVPAPLIARHPGGAAPRRSGR